MLVGIGLIALALFGGWASGSVTQAHLPSHGCVRSCSPSSSAEAAPPTNHQTELIQQLAAPSPSPTEPAGFPYVSARSIAVIEGSCGALLYGRNPHLRLPPASLTKLMTAIVAIEHADANQMITPNVDGSKLYDDTGSTIMGLKPGMELSLLDLLYGLLLPSGNDAAIAIAEGISGTQDAFVELMNDKAKSLALNDSHFINPHGLYDQHLHSSAFDVATLGRYVMQNPILRQIVATQSWQPKWDGPPLWNGNRFLSEYPGADGIKIGYTEQSQQTIVASATRGGRRIIAALMRSQDRYTDAERLLDWAFAQPSSCP